MEEEHLFPGAWGSGFQKRILPTIQLRKGVKLMAIPTNIKTLLSGDVVEWAQIEFKETWDAETSLKTVCAFANDLDNWGGGYFVIGMEENNGVLSILLKEFLQTKQIFTRKAFWQNVN